LTGTGQRVAGGDFSNRSAAGTGTTRSSESKKVSVPTVELRFTALPSHVRTARLVAAAVARRCGLDEAVLDEVRLAVGEACSRAVDLHRRFCPDRPVTVTLTEEGSSFRVAVVDEAPSDQADAGPGGLTEFADFDGDSVPSGVVLAVISGLVDDVSVESGRDGGLVVRMSWPVPAA
jgi:anti-sigma regulatory factor (Ser/Thr protein kinase)